LDVTLKPLGAQVVYSQQLLQEVWYADEILVIDAESLLLALPRVLGGFA